MNTKNLAGWGAILMSLLTALSVAPYTLEGAGVIIPPDWKAPLFFGSIIAAATLKAIRDGQTETKL